VRILLSIHHALSEDRGAPGATLALGRAYEQLGHTVSYHSFGDLPRRLPGVAKELLYPEFFAAHLARGRSEGLDVIDASTGDAWLWARLTGGRRGRPLLVTRSHGLEHRFWQASVGQAGARGVGLPRRSRLYHGGLRLREVAASLRLADVCVFLNRDDLEYACAHLGVARDRAVVGRNGLSAEFLRRPFAPATAGALGIAHIGSWAERKGAPYLTAALSAVLSERADAYVSLLGTGAPAGQVLAAFPSNMHGRIRVVPEYRHGQLPALLEGHQLLVSASLAEGFSLAMPEGMACGLAPVATAISGAREIVRDGENGLLVPPADAAALGAGLLSLHSDRDRLEALRARARESVQELSWERIGKENVGLYEAGLARLRQTPGSRARP
jgi:glycosyltransferase involved in cell wall biosynthesis